MLAHVYLHIPFCDGKCVYCSFYSERYSESMADAFLDCLATELAAYGDLAPETIYIGGGTPSILNADQVVRLTSLVRTHISTDNLQEWTVEANPGTLTTDKLAAFVSAGVNRISLGAQIFDDAILVQTGRRHNAADIGATVSLARSAGITNIGLDLIASLPGVSTDTWCDTLISTIALRPSHVSVYSITVEHDSRLHELVASGTVSIPDDDLQLATLATAEQALCGSGYSRYEISNYALGHNRCLHNLAYWRGSDYVGFGPAAASRVGRARWTNDSDLAGYISAMQAGADPPRTLETVSPAVDISERMMFGLRLDEGVDLADFAEASPDQTARWVHTLEYFSDQGLVQQRGSRWVLTDRGRDVADTVAGALVE